MAVLSHRAGPGDLVAGRFEITATAGEGGMGIVYRAHDRERGETVALKVMRGERTDASELKHEADLLLQLSHPSIVRCIAFGLDEDGRPFLATEWLEGETLRARLKRSSLSLGEAVGIARRVAEGLAAAHTWGIVHRDVTPGNVMLVGGDATRVKVLDFGIAVRRRTQTGPIGTAGYASPEQARGEGAVDARADVFSLGCVLFESLTGERPFGGDSDMAAVARLLLDEAPRVSAKRTGVPKALDDLVARMLAKTPALRPANAAVIASELAAIEARIETDSSSGTRSLTVGEQRALSLLVARTTSAPDPRLLAELERLGSSPESIGDRTIVAQFGGETTGAVERAFRAARGALAVHRFDAGASVDVVTLAGAAAAARAIHAIAQRAPVVGARVDADTARLLGERFELRPASEGAFELVREGGAIAPQGSVLGRRMQCVGREREIGVVVSLFAECKSESVARVALLTGPAGIGKTRVRDEALARIGKGAATVWTAGADPTQSSSALGVVSSLVRAAVGARSDATPPWLGKAISAAAAGFSVGEDRARIAEFLGELVGVRAEASGQLAAAREEPLLMSDQLQRAWEDFVRGFAATAPLVMVVDDLQWADAASVRAIDSVLRVARDLPLLVLLVGRPEAKDGVFRVFADRQPMSISLSKLGAKAAANLVREALGDQAEPELVQAIVERSGGNPFFAEELVRAFSTMERGSVPTAAIAVLEARLGSLEPEARRVLRAGSVLGQSFASEAAAALLGPGFGPDYVDSWGAWLAEREVLVQREEGGWAFRHALVRDAANAMLTEEDRRLAHGLAAAWLEAHGERDAAVLADHYARGGDLKAAARWWTAAATLALEASDLAGAVDLGTRALAGAPDPRTRGEALVVLAEAHRWRGEYEPAGRFAREAMDVVLPSGPRWLKAAAEAVAVCGASGDAEGLELAAQRLLEATPAPEDASLAAIAWCRAAIQLMVRDDPRADVLLDRAAEHATTELARARLAQALATRAGLRGLPDDNARRTEASADAFERAGDLRNACIQRINLVHSWMELGEDAWAREELDRGSQVAQRFALPSAMALARHMEGLVLAREGKLEAALAAQRGALEAFLAQGSERLAGGVRSHVGELLLRMGKLDEALEEATAACGALDRIPPARARALAVLALVHLERGELAEALSRSQEASAILATSSVDTGEGLVLLARAEVLLRAGDASAPHALRDGRDRLLARASTIADPRARASFLANVPEHARLMALAEQRSP